MRFSQVKERPSPGEMAAVSRAIVDALQGDPFSHGPRSQQKHGQRQGRGVDREADGTDGDGAKGTRIVERLADRDDHGDEHPDRACEEHCAGDRRNEREDSQHARSAREANGA